MHLPRSDLHLDPFAVTARDGGMDRTVTVRLGLADIILEPARHGPPAPMDGAKCAITFILRGGDNAETVNIR